MLDRFIQYQSIIENITILRRNVINGLSPQVVDHLKKLIFTEEDWDYLIATRNVLSILNEACGLLSGRRYQTLSISYMVSTGIRNSLLKQSSTPQARIEDTLKKFLIDAFTQHFDNKLSMDQKHAMLISAYLDPYTFHRMSEADKNAAEELILKKLNSIDTAAQSRKSLMVNTLQQQKADPLDLFLAHCGITAATSSTTTNFLRQRTAKEELAFYLDRVQGYGRFEEFWNAYQYDLPHMLNLVRAYNMRPASSVASESLFSKAGYIHRKHRSSLRPDALRYTIFLRDRKLLDSIDQ